MPDSKIQLSVVLQPGTSVVASIAQIAEAREFQGVKVAVAFASEQGVNALTSALQTRDTWTDASKEFLVGIDHGLTQPEALRGLSELPNSEVKIPSFEEAMAHPLFARGKVFHPKIYCFHRPVEGQFALLVGSSNLTGAGLRSNEEAALALTSDSLQEPTRKQIWRDYSRWWSLLWKSSTPLTSDVLEDYTQKRGDFRAVAPDQFVTDEPSPSELAAASSFWIEAGFLSGGSANQLEIPNGVEGFFGVSPIATAERHAFVLEFGPGRWDSWIQFWGNQVWRLRLPTAREGLGGYEESVILFERQREPERLRIQVSVSNTDDATRWARRSRAIGTFRRTVPGRGGRDYGWF